MVGGGEGKEWGGNERGEEGREGKGRGGEERKGRGGKEREGNRYERSMKNKRDIMQVCAIPSTNVPHTYGIKVR